MKKPAVKKPAVVKKTVAEYVDETLDDPVAEKARRQKLVEQADLEAAKELFGTDGAEVDLATYNPKSEKEFTKFGRLVATKFLTPVNQSAFYKEAVKSFNTYATKHMTAAEVKEIEATLVAVRNEKVKAEKALWLSFRVRRVSDCSSASSDISLPIFDRHVMALANARRLSAGIVTSIG